MARILVVDDDADIRLTLQLALESSGHTVDLFPNGASAVNAIQGGLAPQAAVIDWLMPGVDGLEVVQHLRARRATAEIPIVMLTGKVGGEHECFEAGADLYLTKPFRPSLVEATLDVIIHTTADWRRAERLRRQAELLAPAESEA